MKIKSFQIILSGYILLTALSCSDSKLFKELEPEQSGITFSNDLTETDDFNIIDYLYFFNGGGVAIGDINNDDLPDIFFSGNQVKNKLYLNKGGLKFEDISTSAGVEGESSWNTGAIMGDINGDGYLDIYVCSVVGLKGMVGHNELFINNGDNTFKERSREFDLDYDSYSSSAALLDFDLDGDLDIYLLNHAIHSQESFGKADLRNQRTYETGDKLLRNDDSVFVDVSEEAGIYGGINGYGLGIAISDINSDGYPDIFVGNDFHEDDYLYINNGDGTFKESLTSAFTQTSRFTMGADFADINHDGHPDLISLDMLPADETTLKRSDGDERLEILELRTSKYGYYYQFSRNMLQMNNGNGSFSETALQSGIAATDWSWGALFSDFNLDGELDLFISNGIPRRPNDLDYIRFVSSDQVKKTINSTKLVDKEALEMMPSGKVSNLFYSGNGDGSFMDQSTNWITEKPTFSTAAATADLDLDGDLDVVTSNINDLPTIYINQTEDPSNYLTVKLKGNEKNKFGIGAKVIAYQDSEMQFEELFPTRGFQSSSEPTINFGFKTSGNLDSLVISWPDGNKQKLTKVNLNQRLQIDYLVSENQGTVEKRDTGANIFQPINPDLLGLNFTHKEDRYSDFRRQILSPYKQSDKGPALAIGDINNDGFEDVLIGGSKRIPAQVFYQENGKLTKDSNHPIVNDSIDENTELIILDLNNDQSKEIISGTGGADFYGKSDPLLNKIYDTTSEKSIIPNNYHNTSCIKPFDFDGDGFTDVFIGNESVPNDFGKIPASQLLKNNNGNLEPIQLDLFSNLGMITDAVWFDYNSDGQTDLIVVGNWMKPTFIKNNGSSFELDEQLGESQKGLWQSISKFDIDNDGDLDLILGNWGLNSKFSASSTHPLKMYYGDLDKNGATETVLAKYNQDNYYPIAGLDLLSKQLIELRKRFTSYESFAGKSIEDVFGPEMISRAEILEVQNLSSGVLINENGQFKFEPLENDLQVAPILEQKVFDFDNDGKDELLLGGNYFGVQPYHSRFGSFSGALIDHDGSTMKGHEIGLDFFNKSVRAIDVLELQGERYLVVAMNNDKLQLYKF